MPRFPGPCISLVGLPKQFLRGLNGSAVSAPHREGRSRVTRQGIAVFLRFVVSEYKATAFRKAPEIIPVTIHSAAAVRRDASKVESLSVCSQSRGSAVPSMQVADLRLQWQPTSSRAGTS